MSTSHVSFGTGSIVPDWTSFSLRFKLGIGLNFPKDHILNETRQKCICLIEVLFSEPSVTIRLIYFKLHFPWAFIFNAPTDKV